MFNLNGKNALLTGATGGLGKVIARTLVAQGARVVLADMKLEPLQEFQKELGRHGQSDRSRRSGYAA